MGLFDDMTVLLGQGMDAADKRSQLLKLKSDFNRVGTAKDRQLAGLGRAVLLQEKGNPAFVSRFASQIKTIGELEAQERALRERIEALERADILVGGEAMQAANAAIMGCKCPGCGSPVALEAEHCPKCGDNLAALKARFRECPSCHAYYPQGSVFWALREDVWVSLRRKTW